eukprot:gene25788-29133_t
MTDLNTPEIADTVRWLERAVIGLNLCPFAKAPHVKGQIHYVLSEEKGLLYAGNFSGRMNKLPYGRAVFSANLPCASGSVPQVIAATMDVLKKMQAEGPDPADLAKVKANWSNTLRRALQENSYWLAGLLAAYAEGRDPGLLLREEQRIAALTPADLQAAARRYIKFDNYVQAVLHPEPK